MHWIFLSVPGHACLMATNTTYVCVCVFCSTYAVISYSKQWNKIALQKRDIATKQKKWTEKHTLAGENMKINRKEYYLFRFGDDFMFLLWILLLFFVRASARFERKFTGWVACAHIADGSFLFSRRLVQPVSCFLLCALALLFHHCSDCPV